MNLVALDVYADLSSLAVSLSKFLIGSLLLLFLRCFLCVRGPCLEQLP